MQTDHTGSCHCGAIGFTYSTGIQPDCWSIRSCQCSFCRAHGALSTSDPAGRIAFIASKPESLQKYRFGLRTADFLVCRDCGVYIGAVIESSDNAFGIINVRTLRETPPKLAETAAIKAEVHIHDATVTANNRAGV